MGLLFNNKRFLTLFLTQLSGSFKDFSISYNIPKSFIESMKIAKEDKLGFRAIFNISWFWFISVTILSVIPVYIKLHLHSNQMVLTFFLILFIVGISIGSLSCDKLSKRLGEQYMLFIGLIGISLMLFDIFLIGNGGFILPTKLYSLSEFFAQKNSYRILTDFFLISFFSGIYSLPQFATVQRRSKREYLSRVIAANDLINAFFVVLSGALVYLAFEFKVTSIQMFGLLAGGCFFAATIQSGDIISATFKRKEEAINLK